MAETATRTFGCAICFDSFGQQILCTIPCGHVYHEDCLKQWFYTQILRGISSSCPKCRVLAQEFQIIRLFLHEVGFNRDGILEDQTTNNTSDASSRTDMNVRTTNDTDEIDRLIAEIIPYRSNFINIHRNSLIGLEQQVNGLSLDMLLMQSMIETIDSYMNGNLFQSNSTEEN